MPDETTGQVKPTNLPAFYQVIVAMLITATVQKQHTLHVTNAIFISRNGPFITVFCVVVHVITSAQES